MRIKAIVKVRKCEGDDGGEDEDGSAGVGDSEGDLRVRVKMSSLPDTATEHQ